MKQQKGFSLLELLISLMLVTTMVLALLQQLIQTKLLLRQLLLRSGASQFLNRTQELLLVNKIATSKKTSPYHLKIKQHWHGFILQLDWAKNGASLSRGYER